MRRIATPITISALLISTAVLSGCATTPKNADSFKPDTTATLDKATVYLYRDPAFLGGALAPNVSANGVPLADLPSGGYFVYHAAPGSVEFSAHTESHTSVTVDAKVGETYYIKDSIGMGVFVGHPHLALVSGDVGAKEIQQCKLVTAPIPTAEQVAAAQARGTAKK